jgi:hypothetical protein
MIEDQNDINLLGNDLKPCLDLEFDKVEDARICYNAYARKKGFSIRKNHTRLSKGDKY